MAEILEIYPDRESLQIDWQQGKITHEETLKHLKQTGWQPFWKVVPTTNFDSDYLPRWTLQMTVAWLIWRTKDKVIEYSKKYREANETFETLDNGTRYVKSLDKAALVDMVTLDFIGPIKHPFKIYGNVAEALEEIKQTCSRDELKALGFNGRKQVEIPSCQWDNINFHLGPPGDPTKDLVEYKQGMTTITYSDLVFEKESILECWPDPALVVSYRRRKESPTVKFEALLVQAKLAIDKGELESTTQDAVHEWAFAKHGDKAKVRVTRAVAKELSPNGGNTPGVKPKLPIK